MTRLTGCLIAAAGVIAMTVGSVAQQPPGGSRPPGFTADPELFWPLPDSAKAYGAIDGRHLKQYVNEYTAISRKSRDAGNQLWGVLVGTPSDTEAAAWVEAKFRAIGLEIRKQEITVPRTWSPASWEVSASGGGGASVKFSSASPITDSPGTPAAGLDLEAVWVGLGLGPDFIGKDVKGKAAVVHSAAWPGLNSAAGNGAMRRAFDRGAAAIIVVLDAPGNSAGVGIPGQSVTVRQGQTGTVPVQMMIGAKDGAALEALIEKAAPGQPVRVHVRADVKVREGVKGQMVMGVLPGQTDENIYVSAHRDSWYEGAQDNASGVSVMVGLAEYFAKLPKDQRKRTMTFVATPEHHSGSNASEWVHENMKPFLAKTALIINCEHISVTESAYWTEGGAIVLNKTNAHEATRVFVNGSDRLKSAVTKNLTLFGVPTWLTPLSNSSGDLSPLQFDAPSLHIIGRGINFHTTGDTPDVVPASGLEAVARAYAKTIDDVNALQLKDLAAPARPAGTSASARE